jgi:riboflavin kinase/FMN adenylyltransferase
MQIVHSLAQAHPGSDSYVTIGVFDGIHRGHQKLLTDMVEAAHSLHNIAITITFDPHPATTLGYEHPSLLTAVEERAQLMATLGLDLLIVLPFNAATAHTSATDFVAGLIRHLHLAELWGGADFAFGYRREGDVQFLQHMGAERGFAVRIVEPLMWEGAPVSSSRVRTALKAGDIDQASGCLGRPYRLTGTIRYGSDLGPGMGRCTGIPTANLSPPPRRLIPADGVYACLAHTAHLGTHPAMVNISRHFTHTEQGVIVEAHLLDFDADLYNQTLSLDFIARLRNKQPFSTVSALVEQTHKDIAQARDRLSADYSSKLVKLTANG